MDEVEKAEIKKICILSNGTLKEEYNIPNVIRCKECKYMHHELDGSCFCEAWDDMPTQEDGFCSRGKKR